MSCNFWDKVPSLLWKLLIVLLACRKKAEQKWRQLNSLYRTKLKEKEKRKQEGGGGGEEGNKSADVEIFVW